jgi:hypothetical protein
MAYLVINAFLVGIWAASGFGSFWPGWVLAVWGVLLCAVALAVVLYVLWLADTIVLGMSSTRVTGSAVLALGFVASASAVVPGFQQLLHGSRLYLTTTSVLGGAALAAGVVMLWTASGTALAWLMVALVLLWAMATTHHVVLARTEMRAPHAGPAPRPAVHAGRHVGVR